MHARSALFDVYGDLLPARGNRATVAGLVRLLAPVGITGAAVRTAISRMVRQGWLAPLPLAGGRGYLATDQAVRRLELAGQRIYRRQPRPWDGEWQLVIVDAGLSRAARTRVQRDLVYLGYAQLQDQVWVSPYPREELAEVLARCEASAVVARAADFDPPEAPLSAWDLDALARAYVEWLDAAAIRLDAHLAEHDDPQEAAFAARFHLVHEWRKFLFTDPGLPAELLPAHWPGHAAAAYFAQEADRLRGPAEEFVARVL